MKKLTKLAAVLAVLGTVFFGGCSDINAGNGTVYGGPAKEMRDITLNVTSDQKLVTFTEDSRGSSRSILPDTKNYTKFDFYLFYAAAKSTPGANDAPLPVDFIPQENSDGKRGDISIAIPKGNYDFELYAVTKGITVSKYSVVKDEALLVAKTSADIRYVDTIDFYMNAEGLTKKGGVSLSLYAEGWDPKADDITGYTINASMKYLKKTNDGVGDHEAYDVVLGSDVNILTTSASKISTKIPDDYPPPAANYTASNIAPGTYMFELEFVNAAHREIVYYWNDNITVLPGEITTADVPVYPTIESDPKAPKDFVAGYIEDDDLANNEYYTIEFQWDGSEVTTENYYEIEILDVEKQYTSLDDTTGDDFEEPVDVPDATTDDTAWKNLPGATQTVPPADPDGKEKSYTGRTFIGNPEIYVAGSLHRNQTWCQVKAAYGHRYAARIRSVVNKEAGFVSEWVYCDISAGVTADGSGAVDATPFTSKLMNRYKVTYVLNDGTFDPADTPLVYSYSFEPGKVTSSADATDYWNITAGAKAYFTPGTGNPIIDPEQAAQPATAAAPALKDSTGHNWTHWSLNGVDYNAPGSKVTPYTGFENITLYANYAVIGKVYLFDDNDYAIGSVEATPDLTSVSEDKFHHYYVELSESGTHTLDLKITPKTGIVYDQVKVSLTNTKGEKAGTVEVSFDGTDYTASIDSTKYRTGLYRATIEAYTSVRPNAPYTAQITIKMND